MVPTKKPAIAATQRRAVDGDMLTDESRSRVFSLTTRQKENEISYGDQAFLVSSKCK
jgi:hypothetical protein